MPNNENAEPVATIRQHRLMGPSMNPDRITFPLEPRRLHRGLPIAENRQLARGLDPTVPKL